MRTLLLSCLLAGAGALGAAEDPFAQLTAGQGGANQVPARKAVNSTCPVDGNPVNPQIEAVSMLGANNEYVLVGACSQACRDNLRSKLGDESQQAVSAAKQNTTIAKIKATAPATQTPATGFQPVPAPTGTQPLPPPPPTAAAQPKVYTQQPGTANQPAYQPLDSPKPLGAPEKTAAAPEKHGKGDKGDEKPAHKSEHHSSEPISNERGDQSDERQRQKKAAQRRDRGESADEKPTSKKSKKSAKPAEEASASTSENDSLPASAPVLGQ